MRNHLVYDLPLRIFHWVIAGLFATAFLIAKTVDDETDTFSYHMLAGILLAFVVLLRILWGLVGSENSRFSSFALYPRDLISYFYGIFSGSKKTWAGHNPASSWAAITMFGLALGLAATGYLMSIGKAEIFEDLHELMANGFLIVVLLHVAGVVLHGFRHGDRLVFSIIDGRKGDSTEGNSISNPLRVPAAAFVLIIAVASAHLLDNFDQQTRTLNLFGTTIQLGESESESNGAHDEMENGEEEDGDDDDDDD